MSSSGLRARSKSRRRSAIVETALNLFAERGYEATTIADIATAAEMAPRTVTLYFPTKLDIALGSFSDSAERLTAALRDRDRAIPALTIVKQWLVAEEQTPDDDCDSALYARMFAANPELAALRTARMATAITEFTHAVGEDLRIDPSDASIQVCSSAIVAVVMHVATHKHGPKRDAALDAAFRFITGGLTALVPTMPS